MTAIIRSRKALPAAWLMRRGAGIEATTQALHYAAPVGEKDAYVARLLAIVRPFAPDAAT